MNDRGQVTVFLCLLLISMLLIGLTAVEIVRINMGDARTAEAARGAANDVKAAYNKALFEDYHLLAIDRDMCGQGEGKIEQLAEDYLKYTLESDGENGMTVNETALADCRFLLDDDCAAMKSQISEYMEIYTKVDAAQSLLDRLDSEADASRESGDAVTAGRDETNDSDSSWSGTDPRKTLKKALSGGFLSIVTPEGAAPDRTKVDTSLFPSKDNSDSGDDESMWSADSFDDFDELEKRLGADRTEAADSVRDEIYGIYYALEFFNSYTDGDTDNQLRCEVEYLICGKDNDYDNLKGVVNRIIIHRLPVNLAYLLTDSTRIAEVESIALVLALLPGVTYSAAKYLLLGCWAYAETLVDVKILLSGNHVQFLKSDSTWLTDINSLGKLADIESQDYEGVDAIDYEGYLAILLAENSGKMYPRMADIIQLNIRAGEGTFLMKNMLYSLSLDISVTQKRRFASFIESVKGVEKLDGDLYRHGSHVTVTY